MQIRQAMYSRDGSVKLEWLPRVLEKEIGLKMKQ